MTAEPVPIPSAEIVVSGGGRYEPTWDEVYRELRRRFKASGVTFPDTVARNETQRYFDERIEGLRRARDEFERAL